jgi:FixJ family two-component response regulator
MVLITGGLQNKQIAWQLDITENTVEVHRGNLMRKMDAQSLTALVRMADTLGVRRSSG